MRATLFLFSAALTLAAADEYSRDIQPVLDQNCKACHNPANPRNRLNFLKATSAEDLNSSRLMWRDVATQIRNRTMPPMASKLSEAERLRVSKWIDDRLRTTACATGESGLAVAPRRLNRREYHNTIRDLLGIDVVAADLFPADESGGNGFDTNGDTLYVPPMMMERYLEAAQKVLDRVIITPPATRVFPSAEMAPAKPAPKPGRLMAPGESVSAEMVVYVEGSYNLRVSVERKGFALESLVSIDGAPPSTLVYPIDVNGGAAGRLITVPLTRGVHKIQVSAAKHPITFYSLTVEQRQDPVPQDKRALHYRLFGTEAGESPIDAQRAASQLITRFIERAYRRPVTPAEAAPFIAIYDRAVRRGDPYEESVKMALKTVLVSPRFLFRAEDLPANGQPGPVKSYDLASRLSYFLWGTMPDEELLRLAASNRLEDTAVLTAQVNRMLDDPRSRSFANSFVGQWLGTQEIGGRVVPLLTELQHFYTPDVASDLREEPVLLFHHIVSSGRSLLEMLSSNYTFLTARLARFYQVEDQIKTPLSDRFTRVEWPDNRRAGVLGMASVLAMTSHYKQASPILRGAWVLDTLLGTPVPPPPPDVPPLEKASKSDKGLTMRQILSRHRDNAACSSCHNLMDPIGFGLESFDWMGRWRTTDDSGNPIDSKGTLPSGESFDGPVELRNVLLSRREEFLRHATTKLLGYAAGRSMGDEDQCTIEGIVSNLEKTNFNARTWVQAVVLSGTFRNHYPSTAAHPTQSKSTKPVRTRLLGDK